MLTTLAACLSLVILPLAPPPLPTARPALRHCAPCAQLAEDGDSELAPADMAAFVEVRDKAFVTLGLSSATSVRPTN